MMPDINRYDFKKQIIWNLEVVKKDGYKILDAGVSDPAKSFIASERRSKAKFTATCCCSKGDCEAYKRGYCCNAKNTMYRCPNFKVVTVEGRTKTSQYYNLFIDASKKIIEELQESGEIKSERRLSQLNSTMPIGGGFVYIKLPFLNNWVNPIVQELNIIKEHFISSKNFNQKTIYALLEYRPSAVVGGEITSYQKESIPKFIYDLKTYFPDTYEKYIKGTKYEQLIGDFKYIEKNAVLSSLKPGLVKINKVEWNWDGEYLIPTVNTPKTIYGITVDKIKPTKEMIVEIVDEKTIDKENIVLV